MFTCRILKINQLSGTIPAWLGDFASLTQLYVICVRMIGNSGGLTLGVFPCRWLYRNQLSGTIPAELGALTYLTQLYVICEICMVTVFG